MDFHGSRLVFLWFQVGFSWFHVGFSWFQAVFSWFLSKMYLPELNPGPTIQFRSAARRAAKDLVTIKIQMEQWKIIKKHLGHKNQPGTLKNHKNQTGTMENQSGIVKTMKTNLELHGWLQVVSGGSDQFLLQTNKYFFIIYISSSCPSSLRTSNQRLERSVCKY